MSPATAPGILWLVGTPIGNLGDLAPRSREVLARVRVVACEDTRTCRALYTWMGAPAPELVAYHDHNAEAVAPARYLLERVLCVDTAAAGGNASLLTASDGGSSLPASAGGG